MQNLFDVYERLAGKETTTNPNALAVPRYIGVLQNCIKHNVSDYVIQHTHFNDLLLLLMRLDIAQIRQAIQLERGKKNKQSGYNVRNISGNEAIKFLKGGQI